MISRTAFRRYLLLATTITSFAVGGAPVWAQGTGKTTAPNDTPALSSQSNATPEIVVTALKRSERLQSVPASITAVTGNVIEHKQIAIPEDLVQLVPNLQTVQGAGYGVPIFALRGVSLSDTAPNQAGPIATYFDEVYKGSYPLIPVGLYDLERVEVLRGPQGTLYGKNTTGGAINFVTRSPGFSPDGYFTAGYGSYNRLQLEGAAQTGITDNLAVRVAFTLLHQDGWMKNLYPGKPDLNGARQYGIRGSLLWKPTERLSLLLRLSRSRQDPYSYGWYDFLTDAAGVHGVGGGLVTAPYFRTGLSDREIVSEYTPRFIHSTNSVSLTTTWKATDVLTVTSISSYDRGFENAPDDDDGSPTRTLEATKLEAKVDQFAEDLRLSSNLSSPFNFIVGAYYNREKQRDGQSYDVLADAGGVCDLEAFTACVEKTSFNQFKQSEAIYSDLNYKLTNKLTLRGGLRFTHDVGHVSNYDGGYYNLDGVTPAFIGNNNAYASYVNNNLSGKGGLDYAFNRDALAYASLSKGFRGSAFNFNAFDNPVELNPSKPETLTSLEIGTKTQWFDRALTINVSAYYYKYKNQQSQNIVDNFSQLYGIPHTTIAGGELEIIARPVRGITINGGLGLTFSRIGPAVIFGVNVQGNQLPLASKVTANLGVDWIIFDHADRRLTLSVDTNYRSKLYFDNYNTERLAQNGYALANAQLNLNLTKGLEIGFWIKNISNNFYVTNRFDISIYGFDNANIGDPREAGFSAKVKW